MFLKIAPLYKKQSRLIFKNGFLVSEFLLYCILHICVPDESEYCMSPRYHFVTTGGNIQGSLFKNFYIIDEKTPYLVNQNFLLRFRLFFVNSTSTFLSYFKIFFKNLLKLDKITLIFILQINNFGNICSTVYNTVFLSNLFLQFYRRQNMIHCFADMNLTTS